MQATWFKSHDLKFEFQENCRTWSNMWIRYIRSISTNDVISEVIFVPKALKLQEISKLMLELFINIIEFEIIVYLAQKNILSGVFLRLKYSLPLLQCLFTAD